MKFSTQEEYGLRFLLQIARLGEGGSMTIPEISRAEGLSDANVGKILRVLRLGNFVESSRGRVGGYSLSRPPGEIRLSEVLCVLGGRLVNEGFCDGFTGTKEICVHSVECTLLSFWQSIQTAVDQVLETKTLQHLLPPDVEFDGGKALTKVNIS